MARLRPLSLTVPTSANRGQHGPCHGPLGEVTMTQGRIQSFLSPSLKTSWSRWSNAVSFTLCKTKENTRRSKAQVLISCNFRLTHGILGRVSNPASPLKPVGLALADHACLSWNVCVESSCRSVLEGISVEVRSVPLQSFGPRLEIAESISVALSVAHR